MYNIVRAHVQADFKSRSRPLKPSDALLSSDADISAEEARLAGAKGIPVMARPCALDFENCFFFVCVFRAAIDRVMVTYCVIIGLVYACTIFVYTVMKCFESNNNIYIILYWRLRVIVWSRWRSARSHILAVGIRTIVSQAIRNRMAR